MAKTWPDEIEKWDDFKELSYTIVHGTHKAYNLGLPRDIYLINPEGIEWLVTSEIGRQRLEHLDLLVVDESAKFKNSQSKRFKLLKPWLPFFKRRWILTGGLSPNGLEDLFGQSYILDLGRALGRFITHYRREFFHLAGYSLYDWQPNEDAFPKIVERLSPLVLQMSAEDYLEMPEYVDKGLDGRLLGPRVTLPPSVRKLYDDLEQEYIGNWTGEDIVGGTSAVVGGKLRQVANGAIYREEGGYLELHDEKLDALESLLGEFGGSPTLVCYEFNHDKERIQRRFPTVEVLGGGISSAKFNALIDRFNAGSVPVLLGHPASMGHGLNLQGSCNRVVWFGLPWDLDHYDQCIARIYRQGQKNSRVFIYHIIAENTKDEEVCKTLELKDRNQQGLLKALSRHRQEHYGEN